MSSLIQGYNYDIFISYRQKDNRHDGWVTEFVDNLKGELESTFKEEISVYFDINPHDGLLETHDVDESLKEKLKCLIFVPIISRTYCDPKAFAWEHEFKAFVGQASKDEFGLKVKLPNGNVASRVLPVLIHDLDVADIKACESILGGVPRGVEFIYRTAGVNRPLRSKEDNPSNNLNRTFYRDQINKVALTVKDIVSGLKGEPEESKNVPEDEVTGIEKPDVQEKSIIVLPFENMSPDPDQEYFSDGLTEEIITDLSQVHDMLVISRSSAMTFKGTKSTIKEIAERVNVRYVLEGSVRKAGNNLRITAQLIDALTDTHLWAEKYGGNLDNVFDIQEKVSRSIVEVLKVRLSSVEDRKLAKQPIQNIQAYEYYMIAKQGIYTFTRDGLEKAVHYLQQGLELIGENAVLYAGLSYVYAWYVNLGLEQEEYLNQAEEYATKALVIDSESSEAHFVLGLLNEFFLGSAKESIHHFKKALAINPGNSDVLFWLTAGYGINWGKPKKAWQTYNRMMQVDPFNMWTNVSLLEVMSEGRLDLSVDYLTEQLMPQNPGGIFFTVLLLAYCHHFKEACELVEKHVQPDTKDTFFRATYFVKYAIESNKKGIIELLTVDFVKTTRRDCQFCYFVSGLLALSGMNDEAYDWLENAVERGFINYPFISEYDPFLKNIRGEERFKKLMERVKMEWENFEV